MQLKERALANFELLLAYWKIDYQKITPYEYDFINPTREDHDFGACRFNIQKGIGADFAGTNFTKEDFARIGDGFDKSDFAGVVSETNEQTNWGFDIIGLCQRLHAVNSYREAAKLLEKHLKEIAKDTNFIQVTNEHIEKRKKELEERRKKNIEKAHIIWNLGRSIKNTPAEIYLNNRGIYLDELEPDMAFHHRIYNAELKAYIPTLLFKVRDKPNGEHVATHRIYLTKDGKKAPVDEVKMAVGSVLGNAIWFGTKGDILYIAEGPETALAVKCLGMPFVASTVNAANFSNLTIPKYVEKVILLPDRDKAGHSALQKAIKAYRLQRKDVSVAMPGDKYKDWNDVLIEAVNGG